MELLTPAQNDAVWDRTTSSTQLESDVSLVEQVSPSRARALEGMGIQKVRDLVFNFPRRYLDLSKVSSIASANIGNTYTICAQVYEIKTKRPRPKLPLAEITLIDGTGTLIVTMFHMPWITKQIHVGMTLAVAGNLEFNYGFKRMTNPMYEVLNDKSLTLNRVLPVHPSCEKISTIMMRRLVENSLVFVDALPDPIPLSLRLKYGLMSRGRALRCVHFPGSLDEAQEARKRIAYEEILLLQLRLGLELVSRSIDHEPTSHVMGGSHQQSFLSQLPFALTNDQQNACSELSKELSANYCANHMLLGDVGTGKTVCAGFAIAACVDTGTQACLMAPTEVLAQQHAKSLGALFDASGITWELLTGSTSKEERERIISSALRGNIDVLIGTHALLEDDVIVPRCSLVIIDEQQRFGVNQRKKLIDKGDAPDVVFLTATPIPRTLALATLGNMTFSYLNQKPLKAHRITTLLPRDLRGKAYDAVLDACKAGHQAFIVCPLVGSSKSAMNKTKGKGATATNDVFDTEEYLYASVSIQSYDDFEKASNNVTAAKDHAGFLQHKVFSDYTVGLLHGKMPSDEKDQVMEEFRNGTIQILVSTTVIEVGVDVPNATVMIVEDADRFGLSQLHQLRGRVGRGENDAQVFLISGTNNDEALGRLRAMESTEDGLELASYDLSLRREGDVLGNRQSGASTLKLVNITRDAGLIEIAHNDAREILQDDPELKKPEHFFLARECRMLT